MNKNTGKIYMEVKDGYVVVRDIERGNVIDSLVKTKKANEKVTNIFASCDFDSFSKVWDRINEVKGLSMEHRVY